MNIQEKNYYPKHHDDNKHHKKGYRSLLHELFD